jgi:hypothetical protein
VIAVGLVYGLYGLTQQAAHIRIEIENQQLRAENERQRHELEQLNSRVEKVEDTSRKLAEKSGVVDPGTSVPGTGGPALPLDEMGLATLAAKMRRLEEDMPAYESIFGRSQGPSRAGLVDGGIRLAAVDMSSTPDRILKRIRARRWFLAPPDVSRLSVGKTVTDNW